MSDIPKRQFPLQDLLESPFDDESAYEEELARERARRLRDEAYRHAWDTKWAEERARPLSQRRYSFLDEYTELLVRDPRNLRDNPADLERVRRDLVQRWLDQRLEIVSLTGDPLKGDPPDYRLLELPHSPVKETVLLPDGVIMLRLADGGVYLLYEATVALTRAASLSYAKERSGLPGAPSLLHALADKRELGDTVAPAAAENLVKMTAAPQQAEELEGGDRGNVFLEDTEQAIAELWPPSGQSRHSDAG